MHRSEPLVTEEGKEFHALELPWAGYEAKKSIREVLEAGELPMSMRLLEALGPEQAAEVVPWLMDLLAREDDEKLKRPLQYVSPAQALARVALPAPTIVPTLIERLGDERPKVRIAAAEQLLRLGPSAIAAVPALKTRLHDRDPACAVACAAALGAADPADAKFLDVLKTALHSDDFSLRGRVAAYLWMLGPAAAGASDDLVNYVCDIQAVTWFPYYDLNSLKRIGPPAVLALDRALKQALADQERALPAPMEHRWWLSSRVWTLSRELRSALCNSQQTGNGKLAKDSLDDGPLRTMVRSLRSRFIKWALEMAISLLRPESRYIIPTYLGSLGPTAAPAVTTLIAVLNHQGSQGGHFPQYVTVQTLGRIGKDAAPAVPHLLPLIGSDDASTRIEVLHALVEIGASGEEVRARVRPLLKSGEQNERLAAACLLARSGEPLETALHALIKEAAVEHWSASFPEMREEVFASMASFGSAAVPELMVVLKSDEPRVREVAAEVLGKIGPAASDAVPHLIALLDTETSWEPAAEALGKIGPKARVAVPTLVEILESYLAPPEPGADEPTDDDSLSSNDETDANGSGEYHGGRYWDPNAGLYVPFLRALGGIGLPARVAAPTVFKLTDFDDPQVRHVAIQTLARIDPIHPTLPDLVNHWLGEWERRSATDRIDLVFGFEASFDEFADTLSR